MKFTQITRSIEFDAGHRIPNHGGACKNLHGHRYKLDITVQGKIDNSEGSPSEGMLIDFGEIKKIAIQYISDPWDHAFLVSSSDHHLVQFLESLPDHKTIVLDTIPTVENLANLIFSILAEKFNKKFQDRIHLKAIRLYETPNCWADVYAINHQS